MLHTYLKGLIEEVEAAAAVKLRHAAAVTFAGDRRHSCDRTITAGWSRQRPSSSGCMHQPVGSLQINCGQSAGRVRLNASAAPEWSAALDIGCQVAAGSPLLGSSHMLCEAVDACEVQAAGEDGRCLYRPPVQLVVLDSQLQRLGPSTPFRYTAATAPNVNPSLLQQPLLSPVSAPAGSRVRWAADAGTQTVPDWLAADAQHMTGVKVIDGLPLPANLTGSNQQGPQRAYSSVANTVAATSSQRSAGMTPSRPSPWALAHHRVQQRLPVSAAELQGNSSAPGSEPWVPAGSAETAVTAQYAALAAMAWKAKQTSRRHLEGSQSVSATLPLTTRRQKPSPFSQGVIRAGSDDQKAISPASRQHAAQQAHQKARQQLAVSARYAAIGRAAAKEISAVAAQAQQQQQALSNPISSMKTSGTGYKNLVAVQSSTPHHQDLGSEHFKAVPLPTRPWKPAGAARLFDTTAPHRRQREVGKVLDVACSLHELINKLQQRSFAWAGQIDDCAGLGSSTNMQCSSCMKLDGLQIDDASISCGTDISAHLLQGSLHIQSQSSMCDASTGVASEASATRTGNSVASSAAAAVPIASNGQDLSELQALLLETSGEEELESDDYWQLSTAPQPPNIRTAAAATAATAAAAARTVEFSTHGQNMLSSTAALGTSGTAGPTKYQTLGPLTAARGYTAVQVQAAQAGHRLLIKPENTWDDIHMRISGQVPCRQPGSPGIHFDRLHLGNHANKEPATAEVVLPAVPAAAAPQLGLLEAAGALQGSTGSSSDVAWLQCDPQDDSATAWDTSSALGHLAGAGHSDSYPIARSGTEQAAHVLHRLDKISRLENITDADLGLVRFPRLTQHAPPAGNN